MAVWRLLFVLTSLVSIWSLLSPPQVLAVEATTTTAEPDPKWDTSKIWPCATVELYHNDRRPRDNTNSTTAGDSVLLRALYMNDWTFDMSESVVRNYTSSMMDVLRTAYEGFNRSLEVGIPLHSKDIPVNPDNLEIVTLVGIRIQIDILSTRIEPTTDESYQIHIPYPIDTNHSWIDLHAATVYGARHGMETLKQLLKFSWMTNNEAVYTIRDTPLYIDDGPTYSYRGLMIDTARHFLPLDLILTNVHVMAANKLNVLHWHMTDSQSWPYQSQAFPGLSHEGAYCPECVYTRNDVQTVVEQAALHGIRVIAEFDLPGHSQAIGRSHPELLSTCFGGEPSEPLDVTEPAVHDFLDRLYHEIIELFPDDWIHLGGDEVSLDCWKNSTKIQDWMKAYNISSEIELWQYFELDLIALVNTALQKRAIMWQDSVDSGVTLPPLTILDIWKNWLPDALYNITAAGYDVVFSACWYLDHLNEDWWSFYQCDPRGTVHLTEIQESHVLGGHASMWGERVDQADFFERVWPRASATAEILWAGAMSNETSIELVTNRLDRFRCWMIQQFSIPASPITPGYCQIQQNPSVDRFDSKLVGLDNFLPVPKV